MCNVFRPNGSPPDLKLHVALLQWLCADQEGLRRDTKQQEAQLTLKTMCLFCPLAWLDGATVCPSRHNQVLQLQGLDMKHPHSVALSQRF